MSGNNKEILYRRPYQINVKYSDIVLYFPQRCWVSSFLFFIKSNPHKKCMNKWPIKIKHSQLSEIISTSLIPMSQFSPNASTTWKHIKHRTKYKERKERRKKTSNSCNDPKTKRFMFNPKQHHLYCVMDKLTE